MPRGITNAGGGNTQKIKEEILPNGILPITSGGTGGTTAKSARQNLGSWKELWTGTVTNEGSVTVAGINDYSVIAVILRHSSQKLACILPIIDGTFSTGYAASQADANAPVFFRVNGSISGKKIKFDTLIYFSYNGVGLGQTPALNAGDRSYVIAIYGVA